MSEQIRHYETVILPGLLRVMAQECPDAITLNALSHSADILESRRAPVVDARDGEIKALRGLVAMWRKPVFGDGDYYAGVAIAHRECADDLEQVLASSGAGDPDAWKGDEAFEYDVRRILMDMTLAADGDPVEIYARSVEKVQEELDKGRKEIAQLKRQVAQWETLGAEKDMAIRASSAALGAALARVKEATALVELAHDYADECRIYATTPGLRHAAAENLARIDAFLATPTPEKRHER